ncbi:hypothetical protein [Pseudomonas sp. TWR1-1-3]|uniref:hypothetical protein n=1 Tax=Pseudomonas sp. TWR1-1-3 TaxID=2804624 RepID=UPI003CFA54D8
MIEPQLKNMSDLRTAVASLGTEHLNALDSLLADCAKLWALESSVLNKAYMLRNSFWGLSDETGPAGELHAAITGLHIDLEGVAEQRDQLREKLALIA